MQFVEYQNDSGRRVEGWPVYQACEEKEATHFMAYLDEADQKKYKMKEFARFDISKLPLCSGEYMTWAKRLAPKPKKDMAKNETPLEKVEQRKVVKYLEDEKDLKFTSIPNSTWTPSYSEVAKNKAQGLRSGFPDLIIIIPAHRSPDLTARLLVIEMKRQKGGVVSPEQKSWIEALSEIDNVEVHVCKGFEAAKEVIDKFSI